MNAMWFLNNPAEYVLSEPVWDENYGRGEKFFAPTESLTIMMTAVAAQKIHSRYFSTYSHPVGVYSVQWL